MSFTSFDLDWAAADLGAAQLRRLATTVRRCARAHPFYRERLPAGLADGLDAGDREALTRLPVTSKDDFVSDPEAFRLHPEPEQEREYVLWDIAYTAGTTGAPAAPIYQTAYDFRAILFAQRRMAEIRGMTGADRIMNLYPLTPSPHGAWMRANHAAAVLGASVVNGLSGAASMGFPVDRRFDDVVALTRVTQPTVVWGVPSYVRTVLRAAADDGARLTDLRLIAVSGEPCTPRLREDLDALGQRLADNSVVVSDSLGASELQAGMVECRPASGYHNPAPELFLLEALDDDGWPVPDGQEGRLAVTHVDRRGTVLLRYVLGDRVVVTNAACPACGRGGGRILEHRGRSGTRTKIRGNLVDLQSIAAAVERTSGTTEYQIRILGPDEQRDLDELWIRLEGDRDDTPADRVTAAVAAAGGIQPRIEIVPPGSLGHGPALKTRRIVDER